MFDIYSLLASGMDASAIAEEFTKSLNEAETRLNKEKEEARLAEEARISREAELEVAKAVKRDAMADLIIEGLLFIADHYPSFGITAEDVNKAIEGEAESVYQLADLIICLLDLQVLESQRPKSKNKVDVKLKFSGDPAKAIDEMFSMFGMLQ
jgi:hypothetical protein